jgi:hypothetical protein
MSTESTQNVTLASVGVPRLVRRRVFFTMVYHPLKGWFRVGNAYSSKKAAQSWCPFVRGAWRGCRTKVAQFTAVFRDGKLDAKSRRALDEKFNLDAPNDQGHEPLRRVTGEENL